MRVRDGKGRDVTVVVDVWVKPTRTIRVNLVWKGYRQDTFLKLHLGLRKVKLLRDVELILKVTQTSPDRFGGTHNNSATLVYGDCNVIRTNTLHLEEEFNTQ